ELGWETTSPPHAARASVARRKALMPRELAHRGRAGHAATAKRRYRSPAMMTFSPDPLVAEQQMHAIIYYLTAFGYIDGDFDKAEKRFVQEHIGKLVAHRAEEALAAESVRHRDVIDRWTKHFHEILDGVDQQIQGYFTES